MNIKEMDQNSWVCYRFGDNSYYYGEVGLLDQSGVVHPKDNAQLAADPKVKLVKHGFGVYIYDDEQGQCRYQGYWEKDQKCGKGTLKMKDGSSYQGQFKDGCYHDIGIMKWANGDCYDGRWKKNRMDGAGNFKRSDGLCLKGSFKNNYYIDGNVLRNPFMSNSEYEKLKKARKDLVKQYEKNQKIKTGYFERTSCTDSSAFMTLVDRSVKNNRVALAVGSEQSGIFLKDVVQMLKGLEKSCKIVDLRRSFILQGEQKYNYIQQVTKMVQESLKNGQILIISLDDSDNAQEFDELFYPQLKELYSANGLNHQIWGPRDLRKPQIKQKIIEQAEINENFKIMIWSKVKFSQNISDDFLREKLQKRFESVIPFIKIDMIFCEKKTDPVPEGEKKGENP